MAEEFLGSYHTVFCMVSLLFRVKASWSPKTLWRDILIGADRSLVDLQEAINTSFGLDFDHLWFFAKGQSYWESPVKYRSPLEFEYPDPWDEWFDMFLPKREEKHNAADVTLSELELSKGDRLCYLFDYGDEWRFYMILTKMMRDGQGDLAPVEVRRVGDDVEQYMVEEGEDSEEWGF